jgi:hypothetical protein
MGESRDTLRYVLPSLRLGLIPCNTALVRYAKTTKYAHIEPGISISDTPHAEIFVSYDDFEKL